MINAQKLFSIAYNKNLILVGWNIKNFDIPWLFRKLLNNELKVPSNLNMWGKKPWESHNIDMMEMWKNTSNLNVTFEEAVYSMNIKSPKEDICGSQTHETYWTLK
jgi:DNA polymerase elongation subunit (family B)